MVRVGPNEVHFKSLTALNKTYGAGSGLDRTDFYRMLDVYDWPPWPARLIRYSTQNRFTDADMKRHGERKEMLANAYLKSFILQGTTAEQLAEGVKHYLDLLKRLDEKPDDSLRLSINPLWTASSTFSMARS